MSFAGSLQKTLEAVEGLSLPEGDYLRIAMVLKKAHDTKNDEEDAPRVSIIKPNAISIFTTKKGKPLTVNVLEYHSHYGRFMHMDKLKVALNGSIEWISVKDFVNQMCIYIFRFNPSIVLEQMGTQLTTNFKKYRKHMWDFEYKGHDYMLEECPDETCITDAYVIKHLLGIRDGVGE